MSPMVYAIISIKCLQNGHHSAILTFEKKNHYELQKKSIPDLKKFSSYMWQYKMGRTDRRDAML